ncbi:MAG: FAD-dependent oxidoreductase [Caldiserica bacterium]|nr:FAD-dependent oxidoreductase [Caldisericota bacterium]
MEESEKTLSRQQAAIEAERCLYCYDAPCQVKCPAHVPVPEFIQSIRSGNLHGARTLLQDAHPFIETCGRICPEEAFCQSVCTRSKIDGPVRIRELHRFVTDLTDPSDRMELPRAAEGRVAIVGAGPAGLTCARELRIRGFSCDVFEARQAGGVPSQEVSARRYPHEVEEREVRFLTSSFVANVHGERMTDVKHLTADYDAVFVATGLPSEGEMNVEGTQLVGVYHARELLRKMKSGTSSGAGNRVGVIGGGNVAIEVASMLREEDPTRDVIVVYRRGIKELKAFKREIEEATALGVTYQFLAIPDKVVGGHHVEGLQVTQAHLCEEDESGRCRFEPLPGSSFIIPLDTVVVAIGQRVEEGVFPGLARSNSGLISVGDNMQTSMPGVYAGGDAVHGAQTVVEAVRDGKRAAEQIVAFVAGGK